MRLPLPCYVALLSVFAVGFLPTLHSISMLCAYWQGGLFDMDVDDAEVMWAHVPSPWKGHLIAV
jgi:hypothetical protein